MKKIIFYVVLCALISSGAQAGLLMEDAITNAAPGNNLGASVPAPWGSSSSQVKVAAGNLTNAALLSPAVAGNLVYILGTAGGSSYRPFSGSSNISGAVYYSFLFQCTNAPTASGYLTGLLPNGTTSPGGSSDPLAVYFAPNGSGFQLGIRKSGANITNAPTVLATNAIYLVVAKYSFGAGAADDVVSLYLSPAPGAVEPANPDATQTGGTDAANLQNVYFKSSSGYGNWNLDTLRVGTNWADVTPATGAAPPATNSQPVITQTLLGPAGLVLRGTNGTANGVYQVLSASSIILPLTNWPAIATNAFDNSGNFNCTNPISPADAQRFYRLLVGGQLPPTNIAPTIATQPTNQTVIAGSNVSFQIAANGTAPLSYRWNFNTNTPLANATNATLTLSNVSTNDTGGYSVVITNVAGAVTSVVATLTVNPALFVPTITNQPQSLTVTVSNNATFSVGATGTAPLNYLWYFNTNTPLANATNSSLTITNAQTNNAGSYSVVVTNNYGAVTSALVTLKVNTTPTNAPNFGLYGFGQATTGGGVIPETDPAYVKVYTPLDLASAIVSANKTAGSVKVIEVMNDLGLGWNEIGTTVQNLGSTPFREPSNLPLLHPGLLSAGFTVCDIKPKSGLTIFSANGSAIRHCNFNIKSCNNIIIRNLKFDENWEWDEASKGDYDRNDYDFITIANGGSVSNVWIDHCTFTKSYDGIVDQKAGSVNVTFSWNKYVGDDGATNTNSWVRQQINALEANKSAYAFYNFLRTHGFSVENIVQIIQAHDKTHLAGANSQDTDNATLAMTFHHQLVLGVWDRCMPRLRAGNVHNYNLFVDDSNVLAARRLRDVIAATLSSGDQNTLNNTYSFNPPINGSISTESGALLVEKSVYIDCLWPLRNNQTNPGDPTFTGKIMALDSIYHFDNTDNTTIDYRGNSTNAPGNTHFGPSQAPAIAFSWNLPGNQLPYNYSMDDPSQLQNILNSYAGAGTLTWSKTNWLKTSY